MLQNDDNAIRAGDPPIVPAPRQNSTPTEKPAVGRWTLRGLLAVVCYSLLTGGLCYFDRTNFGNEIRLDVVNPPLTRIDVQPRDSEVHVPLLFHYYGFQRPYRLTMYVYDKQKNFDRIELDGVRLELEDGEIVQGMLKWARDINEGEWYGGVHSSGGVYMTHQVLDVTLPRAVPFSITWKGRLRKKGGEIIPLNQKAVYQVQSESTVLPYWLVLYAHTQR
jgi:hypothetical protein